MGRYLKSSVTRDRFQSLDYLFGELTVNQASFYPSLLAFGNLDGRQILLPVSFDLPALIFAQGGSANSKGKFLLGLDDIAAEAHAYNKANAGSATRMGFSPRWDQSCLSQPEVAFPDDLDHGMRNAVSCSVSGHAPVQCPMGGGAPCGTGE